MQALPYSQVFYLVYNVLLQRTVSDLTVIYFKLP